MSFQSTGTLSMTLGKGQTPFLTLCYCAFVMHLCCVCVCVCAHAGCFKALISTVDQEEGHEPICYWPRAFMIEQGGCLFPLCC